MGKQFVGDKEEFPLTCGAALRDGTGPLWRVTEDTKRREPERRFLAGRLRELK